MGDEGEHLSNSPPISKGSYNFNFDQFDDPNFDPFKPKGGLSNSPDKECPDPFNSSKKMSSSPIPSKQLSNNNNKDDGEDPFVSKSKLGQSPPQESSVPPLCTNNDPGQEESEDSFKTATESLVKNVTSKKGLKKKVKKKTAEVMEEPGDVEPCKVEEEATDARLENVEAAEPVVKMPPKKASPKKSGMKKPKARSKFKPPPNFGVQDSEDVVIFAPPPCGDGNVEAEMPVENEPIGSEEHQQVTNHMQALSVGGGAPEMMDSVHDFGAAEMPMENNEEFVQAHEAFPEDAHTWEMMEKMKHNGEVQGRESMSHFDPLADEVPDRSLSRRTSKQEHSGVEDEDLMLMNTPPAKKTGQGSRARNPAARVLQEQVESEGGQREPHILDSSLYSPDKAAAKQHQQQPHPQHHRGVEGDERYFDALEYPQTGPARKGHQTDGDVERMNAVNKKQSGAGASDDGPSDNVVQLVQLLKYSQSDWNKMKQELELDYNARILNKEREWSKKLADREKKITYQEEQILLLRSANDDMKCVVAEFEKTIAQLQAEKLKTTTESQSTFEDVVKERNQALEDLQSVETAFSDLHQRYERTKGVVEGFKKNEETLKKCVQDYQQKLKQAEEKTSSVRQQAEEKLALASIEMEKIQKSAVSDVARLEAAYKKAELKIQGLERSLEQKVQENDELTAICDELIAKVGGE